MPASVAKLETEQPAAPELTDEQRNALLEVAIAKREKVADSELDLARLFLARGKPQFAKRRLQLLVTDFSSTAAAKEARALLRKL